MAETPARLRRAVALASFGAVMTGLSQAVDGPPSVRLGCALVLPTATYILVRKPLPASTRAPAAAILGGIAYGGVQDLLPLSAGLAWTLLGLLALILTLGQMGGTTPSSLAAALDHLLGRRDALNRRADRYRAAVRPLSRRNECFKKKSASHPCSSSSER